MASSLASAKMLPAELCVHGKSTLMGWDDMVVILEWRGVGGWGKSAATADVYCIANICGQTNLALATMFGQVLQ